MSIALKALSNSLKSLAEATAPSQGRIASASDIMLAQKSVMDDTVYGVSHSRISYRQHTSAIDHVSRGLQLALSHLEAVAHTLDAALSGVRATLCTLKNEKERLARAHGLAKLPDEVLSLILMATVDDQDTYSWRTAFHLSTVCRRFKVIVHSTPRMWSSITTDMRGPFVARMSLHRSRKVGLHLTLKGGKTVDDFYARIVEHCGRWESIALSLYGEDFRKVIKNIFPTEAEALRLPSLTHVDIRNFVLERQEELGKLVDYWSTYAPNLQRLTLSIRISGPHSLPASLRRLKLTVNPRHLSNPVSVPHLISLLQSMPLLEELELDLEGIKRFLPYIPPNAQVGVPMPTIRKAHLMFRAYAEVLPLLYALYFPNVVDLEIRLCNKRGAYRFTNEAIPTALEGVAAIFYGKKKYSKLTTLALKLYLLEPRDRLATLDKDLITKYAKNCPALERLTLMCNIAIDHLNLPTLRHLKLIWCPLKSTKWLVDYAEELRRKGSWTSFEGLEADNCELRGCTWDGVVAAYGNTHRVSSTIDKLEIEQNYGINDVDIIPEEEDEHSEDEDGDDGMDED